MVEFIRWNKLLRDVEEKRKDRTTDGAAQIENIDIKDVRQCQSETEKNLHRKNLKK